MDIQIFNWRGTKIHSFRNTLYRS